MKLEAQKRAAGAAASDRRQGRLPAIVYNQVLNVPVSVDLKAFDRVFRSQGTSAVIDLEVDGENHQVLVKAVQMNKRKRVPQHVDFYAVTAGQKVNVHVPIEFVGTAAGTREGGQLDVQRREVADVQRVADGERRDVELEGAGDQAWEHAEVHLAALLPEEAEILDDLDLAVVAVVAPRVVSDEEGGEAEEVEEMEPEVIAKGSEDED